MWTFLAALAGGLVALLGSVGTTYYVQQQAIKAERRARATRAADEILAAATALRVLPREPVWESSDPAEADRHREWSDKMESLIYRIMAQAVLIPMPDFRERLKVAARAMLYSHDLQTFESFSEMGSRDVLCAEIVDCLGAFFQGRPLPPERKTTARARAAIEQALDLEDH
jgi:hypothetical protein